MPSTAPPCGQQLRVTIKTLHQQQKPYHKQADTAASDMSPATSLHSFFASASQAIAASNPTKTRNMSHCAKARWSSRPCNHSPRGMSLLTLLVRLAWKSASSVKQASFTVLPVMQPKCVCTHLNSEQQAFRCTLYVPRILLGELSLKTVCHPPASRLNRRAKAVYITLAVPCTSSETWWDRGKIRCKAS